jgi:hypothetical protein
MECLNIHVELDMPNLANGYPSPDELENNNSSLAKRIRELLLLYNALKVKPCIQHCEVTNTVASNATLQS